MAAMVDMVLLLMAVADSLTMKGQLQLFVPKKSTLSGRISGRDLRWRTKLATLMFRFWLLSMGLRK